MKMILGWIRRIFSFATKPWFVECVRCGVMVSLDWLCGRSAEKDYYAAYCERCGHRWIQGFPF